MTQDERYPFGYGFCACGCGRTTPIAGQNLYDEGIAKGEHRRMCYGHGSRLRIRTPVERIENRRVIEDRGYLTPCWIDSSAKPGKYGAIGVGSRLDGTRGMARVHIVVWEHYYGAVPEGLELDHLCRVPECHNPDHLEPVTHRENTLRGETIAAKHAAKTHCPQGHEYTPENTYNKPNKGGRTSRICRECCRIRDRIAYQRRKNRQSNPQP